MHSKLTRFAAVATAFAVATVGLITAGATAAPVGVNSLSPSSGSTATASFTLLPPAGASCTGSGSGSPAYRWQTYFVDRSLDASTLTYASGPNAVATHFVSPLYDSVGNPIINKNPSASPLGLISSIPTMSFASLAGASGLVAGQYKIGFACTQAGALDAGKYWETPITVSNVTGSSFDYVLGWAPDAPVLGGTLTAADGTLDGTFTQATANPAVTGYSVVARPADYPTHPEVTASPAAGATTFHLTGMANGVSYAVKLTATNTVGTSSFSNTVNGTPYPVAYLGVTGLTATAGVNLVTLKWTNPSDIGSHAPAGYDIVITGSPSVSSVNAPNANYSSSGFDVVIPTAGVSYSFSVTPHYTVPYSAASASVSGTANPPTLLYQNITTTRPVGSLVITQRCGVNGALPSEADSFGAFGVLPILAASADQTGTAPSTPNAGSAGDTLFSQYPYPVDSNGLSNANYPTNCGISLGVGRLVTSGQYAGDYFAATGFINQVSVVDTRDTDPGWTVSGIVSNFTSGSNTFSGNYLGWTPVLTGDSGASIGGLYNQAVTISSRVVPNNATGLTTTTQMAHADAGVGMGIATLDARLRLLIPVTAVNGAYTATLTFTAV
ncbi:MAG: hypothetical protein F2789_11895 [Actinobacteria bacterium]|nr:hypothetical protein [Actinomycetota bacterium]